MRFLLLAFMVLLSITSKACPFCNSKTAKDIRASLFGPDLTFNLFITLLPFLIFSAVVFLIYHGGLPWKKQAAQSLPKIQKP